MLHCNILLELLLYMMYWFVSCFDKRSKHVSVTSWCSLTALPAFFQKCLMSWSVMWTLYATAFSPQKTNSRNPVLKAHACLASCQILTMSVECGDEEFWKSFIWPRESKTSWCSVFKFRCAVFSDLLHLCCFGETTLKCVCCVYVCVCLCVYVCACAITVLVMKDLLINDYYKQQ